MTGLHAVDPRSPGTLSPVQALYVTDHANLKGQGAGKLTPVLNAWVWTNGAFRPFWPQPPQVASITPTDAADWRSQTIRMQAPGATSFVLTAKVGASAPVTLYNGTEAPDKTITWNWFNQAAQFQPGSAVVYELTASNAVGSVVTTVTAALPEIPAPGVLSLTSRTSTSLTVSWPAVAGAVSYELISSAQDGAVFASTTSLSLTWGGMSPSSAHTWAVRAVVQATYVGAAQLTGAAGPYKTFSTTAAAATGPDNGTYTIKPATNATYQWGESGGQSAGWRSTSDDLYHGDGGSVSTRGQQAAHFFYGNRISNAFPDGLGSKTVTKIEIRIHRLTNGGNSAAQGCRWYLHKYSSKPSGAPSGYSGAQDIGALAWGDDEWITLPDSWGAALVNGSYKGVVWGKVAARYMIANSDLGLTTPNGTLRITIGS